MDHKSEYHSAHQFSSGHREQVLESELCGCFYCLKTFPPSEIDGWVGRGEAGVGQTAQCPYCSIDSVIGSKSGVPLTEEFLNGMKQLWFSSKESDEESMERPMSPEEEAIASEVQEALTKLCARDVDPTDS